MARPKLPERHAKASRQAGEHGGNADLRASDAGRFLWAVPTEPLSSPERLHRWLGRIERGGNALPHPAVKWGAGVVLLVGWLALGLPVGPGAPLNVTR